jgi:RNA polymerase sigma factor (sigma-70 family)
MIGAQLHGVLRHLRCLHDAKALTEAPDAQLLEWFARGHEEGPFAALVRRHGPMVWGVARRVLPHEQDAEDVFQATFLLLARKAASIRKAEAVGSWLHGVAHRVALKVRLQQARRQNREKRAADMRSNRSGGESSFSEVRAVLDAALGELPPKYRGALVLCYLEGMTQEEAARRLGCPPATLRTRVARGRKLLRDRLAKHGLTLSAAGVAALLIASAAPAAAPAALARAATGAALSFAAGQPAEAVCSSRAAGLVEGGLRAMFLSKVKTTTALLLATGLIAAAAVLAQRVTAADEKAKQPPAVASAKTPAADDGGRITYGGRVLGPDGRPVAGAKLYATLRTYNSWEPSPLPVCGTTGRDGSFRFTLPKAKFGNAFVDLAATAADHGPGWVGMSVGPSENLTIRLVDDDGPVTGQIVDLEGKPIAGATLRVLRIQTAPGDDLGPWLEAVRLKKGHSGDLEYLYLKHYTTAVSLKATTDAAGRFRLVGIGRNRLVMAQLDGPTIASQRLHILTRPGKAIEAVEFEGRPEYGDPRRVTTYYRANFRHAASPGRPIAGVVRDRDTQKPLAGVTIRSLKLANNPLHYMDGQEHLRTTTDEQGRYRLNGMPKGAGNKVEVSPPGDLPYMAVVVEVPDSPGLDAVTLDVPLKRGVWIEGRITDKVTGQPLQGGVEYLLQYSNPHLRDYPGAGSVFMHAAAVMREDGSYRVVALPGPGMVAVYTPKNNYLRASQRQDEFGVKGLSEEEYPMHVQGSNCGALFRVNPARGTASVKRDVTLDPGWRFTGTVLGPDGKPLAGTRSFQVVGHWWDTEATKTAKFAAWFNPHEAGDIFVQHLEKGLVGVGHPPTRDGGTVTVRMGLGAAFTGRLVDADGKPRAGVALEVMFQPKGWGSWFDYLPEAVRTDREGRFRIGALASGCEFRLSDGKGQLPLDIAPRRGRAKDLGDVQIPPGNIQR